jgi:hypothetical protein
MQANRVNELMAQQYVANVSAGQTLPPINATVPKSSPFSSSLGRGDQASEHLAQFD